MYRYAGDEWTLRNIACSILNDDGSKTDLIGTDAVRIVEDRLRAHVTGEKPIDGDAWVKREIKREQRRKMLACPLLQATASSKPKKAGQSSRSRAKATK